jgi:hypothetical protein
VSRVVEMHKNGNVESTHCSYIRCRTTQVVAQKPLEHSQALSAKNGALKAHTYTHQAQVLRQPSTTLSYKTLLRATQTEMPSRNTCEEDGDVVACGGEMVVGKREW